MATLISPRGVRVCAPENRVDLLLSLGYTPADTGTAATTGTAPRRGRPRKTPPTEPDAP